ncbi:MAG: DUF6468 domain-containing protein [Pseudomonadota bacterium]
MPYGLFVEITLALLLVIAIAYCWRLDQRLKALRSGEDGLLAAARELAQTVAQAQIAVTDLKRSADASGKELQSKIDEARVLASPARHQDTGLRRRMTY